MFIFNSGKLARGRKNVIARPLELDPKDVDTRAHLGPMPAAAETDSAAGARPLLEGVMHEKPDHDYGHTMMALAETLTALGRDRQSPACTGQHITQSHSYPRAKVQMAELYIAKNQADLARAQLKEVLSDDVHAPAFQRKRDRMWIRRAKSLMGKL